MKVKICCISSIEEANLALSYGASAIGLVSHMPSGPGVIQEDRIIDIINDLPESINTFLLTSETKIENITNQLRKLRPKTLQLVDEVEISIYDELRKAEPDIKLVQVVHVIDEGSVDYGKTISKLVDAILLDSGNPELLVKQLGGTGRVHNWDISRKIRDTVEVPVYLAGGLNPENVRDAIKAVDPYGVDLCSGVRTKGNLDEIKLKHFFEAVNSIS